MTPKVGQYSYSRRMNDWCVYICTYADNNGNASEDKVATFQSREEAREYVWQKNGWGKPSKPLTR